jgi:DNA-binding NarL/FixJ family response regulator
MVTNEPIRVVMADDHPQLRARIREALEAGGFEVCAEAATAPAAPAGRRAAGHSHAG